MGKIIYESKGKAGEYSKYAFSAFVGCSCKCSYCFNKKGRFKSVLGGDAPTLKKCFKDKYNAIDIFVEELMLNKEYLQKYGLFFSFTTDPMLTETISLTWSAMNICIAHDIPVKILTKKTDWVQKLIEYDNGITSVFKGKNLVSFGFTLTGHDELEANANTNSERIDAMKKLHASGFKTFASIEPIIDFEASSKMIYETIGFCDLYKIGLESGKKYNINALKRFVEQTISFVYIGGHKIYFKDNILSQLKITRDDMNKWTFAECLVSRDFRLHDYRN